MAEETARLTERLRSVETRQLESQLSIYSADVGQEELIFEVHQLYSWLEDVSVKQQYIENGLEQFAKVQEQMEDKIEQLQKEMQALREQLQSAAPSKPVAKKMPTALKPVSAVPVATGVIQTARFSAACLAKTSAPRQPAMEQAHEPPAKWAKAAAKAARVTKIIIVKVKPPSPAASRPPKPETQRDLQKDP